MAAMVPTMMGVNEATKGTKDHENQRRKNARTQRSHLLVQCPSYEEPLQQRKAVHNAQVYLGTDGKVYITKSNCPQLSLFNGGFYPHPEFPPDNTAGFVTISGEAPPTLRWLYVDSKTHEVRWGGRQESQGNLCGPFDWTKDESRVTLEGWEGWMAVRLPRDEMYAKELDMEDTQGLWRLYFDQNDDGADLPPGAEVLEVILSRTMAES
ncbi:hypothetical protein PENANT_c028G10149 [Penicillium antarcticum]|uniref:Uncharacterized protein n=2 Tax=Penicillium antarcticum TaxID=416450 RepID=A0A1V6PWF5_9EURO|nr:hypothetical protein PENANT_c028G10149 [Penicillium antarcticum]